MFEMDVLQRSRSSYNPTVSFRVYAIRVCSTRGVFTGPPRGALHHSLVTQVARTVALRSREPR